MYKIKYKKTLNLILIFSIFALLSAYFIQYILGHQPCNLCLIERVPYAIVIITIFFCLFFQKFEKITFIILSLTFFLLMLISLYHSGIEQGFVTESFVCDLDVKNNALTKENVLEQLSKRVISCRDVTFRILGLSLATINIFISLILSVIAFKIFLNYGKN